MVARHRVEDLDDYTFRRLLGEFIADAPRRGIRGWVAESLARWGIEPAPGCALCFYLSQQVERLEVEVLQLRLDVADGPRTRVRELERQLEQVNARLAAHNGQRGKR